MDQEMPAIEAQAATGAEPVLATPPRRIPPPPPPPPADEVITAPTAPVAAVTAPAAPAAPSPPPPPEPAPPPEPGTVHMTTELPPSLLEFLFSSHYRDSVKSIQKKFNLSDDDSTFISDLDRIVMAGQLDLEGYLSALEDEFKSLSDEQRDALYAQLLAERFVPLGDFLKPSAIEVARLEELRLPVVAHYQVYFKPLTYSGAATEVATTAGFSIMGGPIRERLRELVMSKFKGVRVDAQVIDMLTRGIDFGGLGLDPKAADRALQAMEDILKRVKVMSEDEYANMLADEARRKAPVPPVSKQPSSPEDEEIARIQASMPQPVVDSSSELAKAVEATMQRLTYHPDGEYLTKRLRNVISSRLRDVRSAIELKQLLMRDTKVGGLGLASQEADNVMKQIETAYQEFHVAISQEEKTKIEAQLEDQKRKVEVRKRQEAEDHAKWFEDKVRARKAGETQQSQVISDMRSVMNAGPTSPIDAKEQRVETAKFGPLVPVAKTGTPSEKQAATAPKNTAPPVASGVRVSPASFELAAAKSASRPSMDGVTYAGPQLVGLVGELKSLTVPEFRRLSKDPQEAIKKIQQKVDTLAQESFEKKIEGIRAFQASPLQAAYMALVGESFRTAKPMAALADEKRKAGGESLSADEIGAIIQLNSALHF